MNKFSALTGIPEFTKGFVRELRVRWALKEMGLPYEAVVYPHPEIKKDPYLRLQPFGQVPFFSDEKVEMFESGAILLHLALKHGKLLSTDERERAATFSWYFAVLNSIEPWLFHHFLLRMKGGEESLLAGAKNSLTKCAGILSEHLWDKEFAAGKRFSIADILVTSVCREIDSIGLLKEFSTLVAYKEKIESRPAFKEALEEHEKLY